MRHTIPASMSPHSNEAPTAGLRGTEAEVMAISDTELILLTKACSWRKTADKDGYQSRLFKQRSSRLNESTVGCYINQAAPATIELLREFLPVLQSRNLRSAALRF